MRTMKDSGVAWIGEIPEGWEIKKARFLFQQRLTKGSKSGVLLASTQQYGIIPQYKIEGAVKVKEDTNLQLFKSVEKNDFVISLRSFQGGIEHSEYEGVCSPAYQVFFNTTPLNHYFFKYLFKSHKFISILNSLSLGIRDGKNIQYKDLAGLYLPFPPLSEQHRIADYLDAKCAEIDNSIELVRQGIDKLKEYKKSVITEAVTKGLDPHKPMKDSGVPWIGEIPEGWEIHTLNNYVQLLPGFAFSSSFFSTDDGIKLLRGINIGVNSINWDECVYYKGELTPKIKVFLLKENDIVIGMDRPWISGGLRVAIMSKNDIPSLLVQRVCKICANEKIHQKYIFYILISPIFENSISGTTTGISVPHISTRQIANCKIPLPSPSEQHRIAAFLAAKCAEIDTLISQKQTLLDKLAEYKKSLIFECVTGKREVAA